MHKSSNFDFLKKDYPTLAKFGLLAEKNTYRDPSTSLVKLRLLSERITELIFKFEQFHGLEHMDQFHRIQFLLTKKIIPREVSDSLHVIRKSGNGAAHDGEGSAHEVKYVLRQAVKLLKWFCTMYDNMEVSTNFIEPERQIDDSERIHELEEELKEATSQIMEYQKKVQQLSFLTNEQRVDRRVRANYVVREIDEIESETRQDIDYQLRMAGWKCEAENINYRINKSLPEKGVSKAIAEWPCGEKWADYALFNGMELLGVVEAKNHNKNSLSVFDTVKEYSYLIQKNSQMLLQNHSKNDEYKVPFMFTTNGRPHIEGVKADTGIWFLDGRKSTNNPKALPEWLSPSELKGLLEFDDILE